MAFEPLFNYPSNPVKFVKIGSQVREKISVFYKNPEI